MDPELTRLDPVASNLASEACESGVPVEVEALLAASEIRSDSMNHLNQAESESPSDSVPAIPVTPSDEEACPEPFSRREHLPPKSCPKPTDDALGLGLTQTPLMETTFVTALYDIGRGKLDPQYNNHRSFDTYRTWFKYLLALPINLIIYVPQALEQFVREQRQRHLNSTISTEIVVREYHELPYAKYQTKFKTIMDQMSQLERKIEMILPEYNVITFSKYPLVHESLVRNPFNSKYFFWIDAGYLREPLYTKEFSFDPARFTCVSNTNQVIVCQTGRDPSFLTAKSKTATFIAQFDALAKERRTQSKPGETTADEFTDAFFKPLSLNYPLPQSAPTLADLLRGLTIAQRKAPIYQINYEVAKAYFNGIPNDVNTSFWGGMNRTVVHVCMLFDQILGQCLNQWQLLNNDQGLFGLVMAAAPALFKLVPKKQQSHHFILLHLAGMASPFMTDYSICPQVKVFTMASKEVSTNRLRYWIDSVQHFGYAHEILGRHQKWSGWPGRTKAYLEAAQAAQREGIPYIACTDGTDLFFCGPSWELVQKLINGKAKTGADAYIGGEKILFYNDPSNLLRFQVERDLESIAQGRYPFPNGGFLAGRTEAVIEILQANLTVTDDQRGYCDLILSAHQSLDTKTTKRPLKCNFQVDYHGDLVGNVPNYGLVEWIEAQIWDLKSGRPIRINHPAQPIAMHFPGTSGQIHDFYRAVHKVQRTLDANNTWQAEADNGEPWPWYYWLILGVFLFILLLVILWLISRSNSAGSMSATSRKATG